MIEPRLKVATCSLAGCFGCHMSILDLDERLFTLVDLVEFDRSPITGQTSGSAANWTGYGDSKVKLRGRSWA